MNELIWMFLVFACGAFSGFIGGAFIVAKRDADDFDGGFQHDHPPVRTTIWSRDINTKDTPS